jgi:hypothetical protein
MRRLLPWALLGLFVTAPAVAAPPRVPTVIRAQRRQASVALRARMSAQDVELRTLASGMRTALDKDPAGVAEKLFHQEMSALALLQKIGELSDGERRDRLLVDAINLVQRIIYQKDQVVGPAAISTVRRVRPGEPLTSVVEDAGRDRYRLLDRADTMSLSTSAGRVGKALYRARQAEFLAAGGDPSQVVKLDRQFLEDLGSGQLVNWVHRTADDEIWVSTRAKHVVTAAGEDAFGGGDLKLYKNSRGEKLLAIVTNASGSIKSSASSLEAAADRLVKAGWPRERILYAAHTPADTQLLKLFLVSDLSLTPAEVEGRLQAAKRDVAAVERTLP